MVTRSITTGGGNDRIWLPGDQRVNWVIASGDGNDGIITNGLGGNFTVFVNSGFGHTDHVYSASLDPTRPIHGWVLNRDATDFLGYHNYQVAATGTHVRISKVDMDLFLDRGVYKMEVAHVHGRVDFHGRGDPDRPALMKAFDPVSQEIGMAASEGDYKVYGVKTLSVFADREDGDGFIFYPSGFTVHGDTISPGEAHISPAEHATHDQTVQFIDLGMLQGEALREYRLEIEVNTYEARRQAVEDMIFDRQDPDSWVSRGTFDAEI